MIDRWIDTVGSQLHSFVGIMVSFHWVICVKAGLEHTSGLGSHKLKKAALQLADSCEKMWTAMHLLGQNNIWSSCQFFCPTSATNAADMGSAQIHKSAHLRYWKKLASWKAVSGALSRESAGGANLKPPRIARRTRKFYTQLGRSQRQMQPLVGINSFQSFELQEDKLSSVPLSAYCGRSRQAVSKIDGTFWLLEFSQEIWLPTLRYSYGNILL